MATAASGLVAPAAQASEASTVEAQNGNVAQAAPQSVVNVASNIVVDVARAPYTSWSSPQNGQGVQATAAPSYNYSTTDYSNYNSSDYWAQQAASNGWTSYWYYDANGNYQTGGTNTSTNTGGTTATNTNYNNTGYNTNTASNTTTTGTTTGTTTTGTTTTGTTTTGTTTDTTSSDVGANAASIASQYMGLYNYGYGNTPAAWNCTGFTSYVYNQAGVSLPWGMPYDQANWALANGARQVYTPIAGDLVIQADGGTGQAHAGIYAGDGYMYAAISSSYGTNLQPVSWGSGTSYYRF
ncbi:MAG: NlpC/P60 family protein [Micrococcaceae bacterium]